jgi:hypothetical protein
MMSGLAFRFLHRRDHCGEIVAGGCEIATAKRVVAAELDDDDRRLVRASNTGNRARPPARRVAEMLAFTTR